jgi:hypothetical protein
MEVPPKTLYGLPDGPLTIILEFLMAIDPTTLVGAVARLGTRLPTLCRNNITLKQEAGWFVDRKNSVTHADCIAGVAVFRWAKDLDFGLFSFFSQYITDATLDTMARPAARISLPSTRRDVTT